MTAVMASSADNGVVSNDFAGFSNRRVSLSDMHAVCAKLSRQIWPVVDQHSDTTFLRSRNDPLRYFADMRIRRGHAIFVFQSDLQTRDIATVERRV